MRHVNQVQLPPLLGGQPAEERTGLELALVRLHALEHVQEVAHGRPRVGPCRRKELGRRLDADRHAARLDQAPPDERREQGSQQPRRPVGKAGQRLFTDGAEVLADLRQVPLAGLVVALRFQALDLLGHGLEVLQIKLTALHGILVVKRWY